MWGGMRWRVCSRGSGSEGWGGGPGAQPPPPGYQEGRRRRELQLVVYKFPKGIIEILEKINV